MKRKYDLLMFDMDGTLADTDPMLFETFNVLYDKYRPGFRRPKEEIYYFSGPPIRETLKKEFPDLEPNFIFDEFCKTSRPFYDTHVFSYEHSQEVLEDLKKDGFLLAVVTNKQHALSIVTLKNLHLDHLFDYVIGYDDVSKGKPDKEGILKVIDHYHIDKSRSLYIGDNALDLLTADNAGIDCYLVDWGPRVLSKDLRPKDKIKSYLDLKEKVYE